MSRTLYTFVGQPLSKQLFKNLLDLAWQISTCSFSKLLYSYTLVFTVSNVITCVVHI